MYLNDIFTIPAPLAGLPGLSIPCGFDAKGLPVGLQIIAPAMADDRLYNVGAALEAALLDVFGYLDRNRDGFRENPDGSPLVLRQLETIEQERAAAISSLEHGAAAVLRVEPHVEERQRSPLVPRARGHLLPRHPQHRVVRIGKHGLLGLKTRHRTVRAVD